MKLGLGSRKGLAAKGSPLTTHENKFHKICGYLKTIRNAERVIDRYERSIYNRVFNQNLKNGAFE